ncbi:MAG: zinc ribbon domain-containing protein [SAR324 cluster bacterium]|nr:zinc ribbon domain-containing protein [SAR324 cluster bacterium]
MPIYEYVCSNCKHEFEELQKFSDPPVTDCPSCHRKGRVARMLSQSAFMLRGSGWYSDGYSSGAAKSGNGAGDSKVESKGDSKGASKDGGGSKDSGGSSASEGSGSSGSGKSESKSTGSSTR